MGLCVNYTIKFNGSKSELLERLNEVRSEILKLNIEKVSEISEGKGKIGFSIELIELEQYFKLLFQNIKGMNDFELACVLIFENEEETINWFRRGCENYTKRLQETEEKGIDITEEYIGRDFSEAVNPELFLNSEINEMKRSEDLWIVSDFIKTQVAVEFEDAHLMIIKMLEIVEHCGFSVIVRDEGAYWNSRDIRELKKRKEEYDELIRSMAGGFSGEARRDFEEEDLKQYFEGLKGDIVDCEKSIRSIMTGEWDRKDLDKLGNEVVDKLYGCLEKIEKIEEEVAFDSTQKE